MTFEVGRHGKAGWLRKLCTSASGRVVGSERRIWRTCLGPAAAHLEPLLPDPATTARKAGPSSSLAPSADHAEADAPGRLGEMAWLGARLS